MAVLQGSVSKSGISSNLLSSIGNVAGGLLGGLFGGNQGSSAIDLNIQDLYNMEMYNTIKDLYMQSVQDTYNKSNMDYQAKLNAQSEERQYNYQRALAEQQFNYNNYFIDNAYQKTVADMRKAGLNPLLAIQQGSNTGSVGMGSATALGASLPSAAAVTGSGTDISSFLSASANSANAKTAKEQLKINMLNGLTDIMSKYANSSLALQQAQTESNKRDLLDIQTALGTVDKQQKELNLELDRKYADKERILGLKATLTGIKTSLINAFANQTSASAGARKDTASAISTERENEFYNKHPYAYGTDKVLESLSPLLGLIGPAMIAKGLGKRGYGSNNVKGVIQTPPKGFIYQ